MSKDYINELLTNFYESKGKKVRYITMLTYTTRLSFLNKILKIENVKDYLKYKDFDFVIETLEKKYTKEGSLTVSVASILILLQAVGVNEDDICLERYRDYLSLVQRRKDAKCHEKLNSVGVLSITNELINTLKKEYKSNLKKINLKNDLVYYDKEKIQDYVIFCIYTMLPPCRNDLCNMLVVDEYSDDLDSNFNYLINNVEGYFMCYKNFKTVNLYGENKFKIKNNNLIRVLDKYLPFCGDDNYLIIGPKGKPFSKSSMSQRICRIFSNVGGCTQLRKWYLSNQFQELFKINKSLNDTAKMMMNSKKIICSSYLQLLSADC
jgi:hypothetical protein